LIATADFGKQDHVLTPLQSYIQSSIDKLFDVQPHELENSPLTISSGEIPSEKPFITLKRVDIKKGGTQ